MIVEPWTLPIRIYLGVQAHNKFKMLDLFLRVKTKLSHILTISYKPIKTFKPHEDHTIKLTLGKMC